MRQATYRMIRFPKLDRYIGVAWNYDQAILLSTGDYATYSEARDQLGKVCAEHNVELRWFDGEYDYAENGQLVTLDNVRVPIGGENPR